MTDSARHCTTGVLYSWLSNIQCAQCHVMFEVRQFNDRGNIGVMKCYTIFPDMRLALPQTGQTLRAKNPVRNLAEAMSRRNQARSWRYLSMQTSGCWVDINSALVSLPQGVYKVHDGCKHELPGQWPCPPQVILTSFKTLFFSRRVLWFDSQAPVRIYVVPDAV